MIRSGPRNSLDARSDSLQRCSGKGSIGEREEGGGIFEMVSVDLGLICSTFLRSVVTSRRSADQRRWPVS